MSIFSLALLLTLAASATARVHTNTFNEDDAVSFDDLLDATQTLIPKGAAAARESVVERRGFAASGDGMGSPHPSATRLNAGAEVV